MSLAKIQQLLHDTAWSERDEADLVFWWVVKYTEPEEAGQVLASLPQDVRARFVRWLTDKDPVTPWIDRAGISDGPDDINIRLRALHTAVLKQK